MRENPEVTIIFPALNERARLPDTIQKYRDYFGVRAKLLVVDNGSTDGTAQLIEEQFGQTVEVLKFDQVLGKGGAVYAGFNHLDLQGLGVMGFTDADGSTTPDQFDKLVQAVADNQADITIASRWVPGAQISKRQPLMRLISSRLFNLLVRVLFGLKIKDTQCGAKVMRAEVYHQLRSDLTITGFAFDVELLIRARALGFRIAEIPIDWLHTTGSTLSFKSQMRAVRDVLRLRFGPK